MMQDRLTEIEIKLSHLDNTLNELNNVMVQHSNLIDRLSLRCNQLGEQLNATEGNPSASGPDSEKPPHY